MKKIEIAALLIISVMTLSACNRGYGCPYGMQVDLSEFISTLIPVL